MRISRCHVVGNWLSGSVRRRAVAATAALAASLLAVQSLSVGTAEAFDGPDWHHQFVQISTRDSPTWSAKMDLYDWQGNLVHTWRHGYRKGEVGAIGGKQTWWFTAGKGSRVEVHVVGLSLYTPGEERKTFWFEPGSPDGYCFHVTPLGDVNFTGDSNTGGCTPD